MVVYFAADLLWASKIKATADALGIPCRPVRSVEMLEARLADSDVTAMVADLDDEATAMLLIGRLRRETATPGERRVRILAWGPHVEKELLQRARAAGADEVLTRGGFDHGMEEILIGLASKHAEGVG